MDEVAAVATAVAGHGAHERGRAAVAAERARVRAPITYSRATATMVNELANTMSSAAMLPVPAAMTVSTVAAMATAAGSSAARPNAAQRPRPQGSSGASPESATIASADGVAYCENQVVLTEEASPVSASEISGKNVPHSTTTASTMSARLPSRTSTRARGAGSRPRAAASTGA